MSVQEQPASTVTVEPYYGRIVAQPTPIVRPYAQTGMSAQACMPHSGRHTIVRGFPVLPPILEHGKTVHHTHYFVSDRQAVEVDQVSAKTVRRRLRRQILGREFHALPIRCRAFDVVDAKVAAMYDPCGVQEALPSSPPDCVAKVAQEERTRSIVSTLLRGAKCARRSLFAVSMLLAVASAAPSTAAYSTSGTLAAAQHVTAAQRKSVLGPWVPAQPNKTSTYGMRASASLDLPQLTAPGGRVVSIICDSAASTPHLAEGPSTHISY